MARVRGTKCRKFGVDFDSQAELSYAIELEAALRRGEIISWAAHPRFQLEAGAYTADFMVLEPGGMRVVDVKGRGAPLARTYKRNVRAMRTRYGINVETVER